jgi:hypothetical protein
MAGEQKGKAYEAFTKAALLRLKGKRLFKGDIFWDEKPDGMTIVPDLSIGPEKDKPHTIILITHSGSAGNSHMKTWRNMGELVEAKVFLSTVPKVFNLAFDSVIKENLKDAQAASFDGQLLVGDRKYGDNLQQWIDHNLKRLPKDKHEKVDFITAEARSNKTLEALLDQFTVDLEALLKKNAPAELDQVWAMERKRTPGRAPRARDTYVRRGLSKLLIFEDLDVALRLFSGKRVRADEVPEYAYELGLATRFTSGVSGIAKPADEEIVNAVTTLGEIGSGTVMANPLEAGVRNQVLKIRQLSLLGEYRKYLCRNLNTLKTPEGMEQHLRKLHHDPKYSFSSSLQNADVNNVWLFDFLAALFKANTGKSQSFGYSTFAKHRLSRSSKIGTMWIGEWCTCFMNQYISRSASFSVSHEALKFFATVLADHLLDFYISDVDGLVPKIKEQFITKEFEAVLMAHRGFEPLRVLIECQVVGCKLDKIRSCFGEKIALQGQATKTTALRKGKTLINWQSAHASHTNDKKKELCGRAVALRYSWDAKAKKFIRRPGVEKLILVVDGTWKREDLLTLARAGWDEIFYPDEMDKLAKAIV